MESTVTALQMRKKFGSILNRVSKKGDHITILRGNEPLAVIIPVQEHERQCAAQGRIQKVEEVLGKLEEWKKKNAKKLKALSKQDSTEFIRKMRDSR